jgi:protein phosphatase 1 regulatory subunit 37
MSDAEAVDRPEPIETSVQSDQEAQESPAEAAAQPKDDLAEEPTSTDPAKDDVMAITPLPSLAPHRTRSKPKKGILKPPPPPVKPGFGGKLRDALGSIHPKFLDYAAPGANGQVAAAAQNIAAGPVGNIANGVIEGAGVIGGAVGGAAAAVVGTWGGKLGRFVSGNSPSSSGTAGTSLQLPWKLQTAYGSSKAHDRNMDTNGIPRVSTVESALTKPLSALSVTLGSASSPLPLDAHKPLKRASFLLPLISITYPISSTNAPWSEKILADRDEIERTKDQEVTSVTAQDYWTQARLVALYESACKGREEMIRSGIVNALNVSILLMVSEDVIITGTDNVILHLRPHWMTAHRRNPRDKYFSLILRRRPPIID